jgi:hypothetical protein
VDTPIVPHAAFFLQDYVDITQSLPKKRPMPVEAGDGFGCRYSLDPNHAILGKIGK